MSDLNPTELALRAIMAQAWDEGMEAAQRAASLGTYTPDNPYREEQ